MITIINYLKHFEYLSDSKLALTQHEKPKIYHEDTD